MKKPNVTNGPVQKEIDRLDAEFKAKSEQMSNLTQEEINKAPLKEVEPQTKLSQAQIKELDAPKIVPSRTKKANGKKKPEQDSLRKRAWEYIKVICENNEIFQEPLKFWYKPMIGGEDCHYWEIPVGRPVYIPRHVAEHIRSRKYHRLVMQEEMTVEHTQFGEMRGKMVATETRQRLDCRVVGFD